MTRHHDTDRFYLVNRRVGAVTTATESVEQDFPFELATQPARQRAVAGAPPRRAGGLL